jgi:hypothetical protein
VPTFKFQQEKSEVLGLRQFLETSNRATHMSLVFNIGGASVFVAGSGFSLRNPSPISNASLFRLWSKGDTESGARNRLSAIHLRCSRPATRIACQLYGGGEVEGISGSIDMFPYDFYKQIETQYGVMTYSVVRRTNEIGIRMALGSQGGGVLWMVLRESLLLLGIGVAVGVPATLAATRLVRSQLYGLSPSDPVTLVTAVVVVTSVTLLAAYLPSRRAMRVDPMVALHYE